VTFFIPNGKLLIGTSTHMTLSIISSSTEEFLGGARLIGKGDANSTLQLSFELERDTLLAKQALFIEKFAPLVFKALPGFKNYDPTMCLPPEVRAKAIRLFPRNLLQPELDDVQGMLSSMYAENGAFVGSMVWAAFDTPLSHALRLFNFLANVPKVASVTYDILKNLVEVNFDNANSKARGFWFEANPKEIQTIDLQQAISDNAYLGVAFPITPAAYEDFMVGKLIHKNMDQLPEDFYKRQVINDWLVVHIKQNKIAKQSWLLQDDSLKRQFPRAQIGAEEWLTA
jgi:hypothetical protein